MRKLGWAVLAMGGVAVWQWAATRVPRGVEPVTDFDARRYAGRWFEIARLDHRFERGMTDVTADYAPAPGGRLSVVNRGRRDGRCRSVKGSARFLAGPGTASLAVRFFAGIEGGYHVFALDPEYRWSLVSGPNRGYLWVLARERSMDAATWARVTSIARDAGFDTARLIRVEQSGEPCGSAP